MTSARILVCVKCGEEFVFTADAQEYLEKLGYKNDPKFCKSCHLEKKNKERNQNPGT